MVSSLKASARESESGKEAAQTLDGGAPSGMHSDEAHVRVRTTRIGRFTLLHEIGSGGMGAVFAAYDEQLDRKVALKILRQTRSGAQWQRQRTLREARAAARITHPNVIAVYEVGESDGNIHIAMEYVEGGTLLEWQTQVRRPWREILKMYLQAGEALLAAHDAEVVHRDFKPDTVSSTAARTLAFRTAARATPPGRRMRTPVAGVRSGSQIT